MTKKNNAMKTAAIFMALVMIPNVIVHYKCQWLINNQLTEL